METTESPAEKNAVRFSVDESKAERENCGKHSENVAVQGDGKESDKATEWEEGKGENYGDAASENARCHYKVKILLKLAANLPRAEATGTISTNESRALDPSSLEHKTNSAEENSSISISEEECLAASDASKGTFAALLADACCAVRDEVKANRQLNTTREAQPRRDNRGFWGHYNEGNSHGSREEIAVTKDLKDAYWRSLRWLEARGETLADYKRHEIRLSVCRRQQSSEGKIEASAVNIPIHYDEAGFLRRSIEQIEHSANFKSTRREGIDAAILFDDAPEENSDSDRNGKRGCGAWPWSKTSALEKQRTRRDPTDRHKIYVYSLVDPSKLLGVMSIAIRYLPASPALYIFNKYDHDGNGVIRRAEVRRLAFVL